MKYLFNFLKGIAIGIATIVPGVSGGTMAIIVGLYDKIIHSISSFFKDIKNNIIFLFTVGLGGLVGLFAFSNIIDYSFNNFRYPTIFLFLGIIIGGLPLLYKKSDIKKIKPMDYIPFIIGLTLVIITSFLKGTFVNLANSEGILNILFMILAGIIFAVALILPGISGSFFLLAIGLYDITMLAIKDLNFTYLIPLAVGTGLGIILTARVLEKLMEKRKKGTYLLILGFVIGSVIVLFIDNIPYGINILYSIITFIIGFIITMLIIKTGSKYNLN